MKHFLFILSALSLTVCLASAQPKNPVTPAEEEALMRHWIATLGSDDFGGRKPMTEYETKTIEYLAGQMREIGLKPAFGDSYFQEVKTISTVSRPVGGKFRVKGA